MKKIKILIYLIFILGVGKVKAQTGMYIPQLVNFDTAMKGLMKRFHVPGGELAITRYGHLIYNRGFGYADTATHTLVQPNSIFRLASVTKPITAIAIMHLYQEGKIYLDDTVFGARGILNDTNYRYIKDSRVYNITVRDLLTHSGGWNSTISGDPMFESYAISTAMGVTPPAGSVTVIEYVIRNQMLDFMPGTQYQYSNFGFCILGRVIEKITGEKYENFVHDSILAPLDITDMHEGHNLLANKLPMEVNYYDYPGAPLTYSVYDNKTLVPWPYAGFNIEAMDSHGEWVASAADLCKILVSVDNFHTNPQILSSSTIDTMVHPSSTNPNYALGWNVNVYNNWWHEGSLPGTTTEIVRASNQMNWAILYNTRNNNFDSIATAIDQLVWSVIPTISTWDTINLFSGINSVNADNISNVSVYPNPNNGIFTLQVINSQRPIANSHIEIYNVLGEKVYSSYQITKSSNCQIDLSNQPNGVYLYRVVSENGNMVGQAKLIIQK